MSPKDRHIQELLTNTRLTWPRQEHTLLAKQYAISANSLLMSHSDTTTYVSP